MNKFLFYILFIGLFILLLKVCGNSSANEKGSSQNRSNGDLDSTFALSSKAITPEEQEKIEREKLIAEGWETSSLDNGLMPKCYNFKSRFDKSIANSLEISVGGGTDVVVKLINSESGKCIRYVFINSGTTFQIRNIPQGVYFVKIAYGKEWLSKLEGGKCVGKFLKQPLYERGEDIMDFRIQKQVDGYSIPSFRLSLDVISSDRQNSFSSHNITENDFNS